MTPEEQRQKKNQESLESYNWYKAHHVCVRCRNASATDGFVTCQNDQRRASLLVRCINARTEEKRTGKNKSHSG